MKVSPFQRHVLDYAVALLAVAVSVWVRVLLNPWLGEQVAYITIFPTVIVVSIVLGARVGVASCAFGILLVEWLVIVPPGTIVWDFSFAMRSTILLGMSFYVGWVSRRLREARAAAEQAARLLAEQREELQLILDTTPASIFYKDRENRFVRVNRELAQLMGVPRQELEGRSLFELYGREQAEAYWRDDKEVIASEKPKTDIVERMRTPDGERWFQTSKVPCRNGRGSIIGVIGFALDITERRRAEEGLRANQARLAAFAAATFEGIVESREGKIVTCNEQFAHMVGRTRTELAGMAVIDLVAPEDRQQVLANVGANRESVTEHRLVRKDGTWLTVEARGRPAGDEGVRYTAIRDISERKQAEAALRESELRYRAIGESIAYGVWVCAPDGRNIYASPSFLKLVGLTQEQCSNFGWGDVMHPDDAARTIAAWKECVRTGSLWDIEHRFRGLDGKYHPVLARGVPVRNDQGDIVCWAGINLDIGRLKEAEAALRESEARAQVAEAVRVERQRLREVLDVLPAYVVLLAPDHRLRLANRFFEERFGRSQGRRGYEHPFQRSEPCENCESFTVLKTQAPHHWEWRGPDGRIYEIYDSPFADTDGTQLVLEVGLDITERRRVEQEERLLREELARFSRITTAGQLAASLAHELNQPLGAIVCNIQAIQNYMARGGADQPELGEALKDIETDGKRAGAIIHQLRRLYQKTGQAKASLQVNNVVQQTLDLLRSEFVMRGVELKLELEPRLPAVPGNEVELQQLVLNLVTNAVDAMGAHDPGSRRLCIRTASVGSDRVHVSVRDSGPGIAKEQLERLFEPFYTTKATGMGMGLSISQSIVEGHNGKLWAENNAEGGATFHFTLPTNGESAA